MKRVMLSALAIGIMAATSQAATLSIRWASTAADKVSLMPSQTAEIEVLVEGLAAGDTLSTVFFSMEAQPITHLSNSAEISGWDAGGQVNLPFGPSQFAVGSNPPGGPSDVIGPGTFLLGSFFVRLDEDGLPAGTEYEVAFSATANTGLLNSAGTAFVLDLRPGYASYSGYYVFGKGSPGITQMANSIPRDPLIITKVPEPASLALLAIGGFAVMMRRRG